MDITDVLRIGQGDIASKKAIDSLIGHIIDELEATKFFATDEVKPVMIQNLSNMFVRMRMTTQENRTFHGIIKALAGRSWQKNKK